MSLARQHQMRVLAASGGNVIASIGGTPLATAGAANSPAPHRADTGPAATAYQLMLMQLAADRRRLKLIQSIERKISVKREILPTYAAWVDGVLEGAKRTGRGVQDEVLATVMVWRIDTGDFAGALPLRNKKGAIKRQARAQTMFRGLRKSAFLKVQASADQASVGFFDPAIARIARVHQYGLRDRVVREPGAPIVAYSARVLLGFTAEDRDKLADAMLNQLQY